MPDDGAGSARGVPSIDRTSAVPAHAGTAPTRPATAATPHRALPALSELQGMPLLRAVFPGRAVRFERTKGALDEPAPEEPVATEPIDAAEDDFDPGDAAPPPRTP